MAGVGVLPKMKIKKEPLDNQPAAADYDDNDDDSNDQIEILSTPEKDLIISTVNLDSESDDGQLETGTKKQNVIDSTENPKSKKKKKGGKHFPPPPKRPKRNDFKKSKLALVGVYRTSSNVTPPPTNTTSDSDSDTNDDNDTTTNQGQNTSRQTDTYYDLNNYNIQDLDVVKDSLTIEAQNRDQEYINRIIDVLSKCPEKTTFLKSLTIKTDPDDNIHLKAKQIRQLISMPSPKLCKIHIVANIHENVSAGMMEELFIKLGDNLTHFCITGGYVGTIKKPIIIRLPPMPKLVSLSFQCDYEFDRKVEKMSEVVMIDDNDNESDSDGQSDAENQLFRITLSLPRLKNLKELILGNCINVISTDITRGDPVEFYFDYYEKLETFHVGSNWDHVVKYIPKQMQKIQYKCKSVQFPDFLRDSKVITKIAQEFPKLQEIHINLPSPVVLQTLLVTMSKLRITKLILKSGYVFPETLEKILFGSCLMVEDEEEKKINYFRKHGSLAGFDDNDDDEDRREKTVGIGGLVYLTELKIDHIPRWIYFSEFDIMIGYENDYEIASANLRERDQTLFINQIKKIKNLKKFDFPKFWMQCGRNKFRDFLFTSKKFKVEKKDNYNEAASGSNTSKQLKVSKNISNVKVELKKEMNK